MRQTAATSRPPQPRPPVVGDDELAADWCFDRTVPVVPEIAPRDPRAVLEEEILRGLQRSPCCVAFSGGCDSSGILSLAVHLARREGLPEPIALTKRFPHGHPDQNEDAWQELVIRELGVADWQRVEVPELEIIGPAAERLCARVGVLCPPLFHTDEPIMPYVAGGALLTGEYGDDLNLPWDGAIVPDLLRRRRRPSPRALVGAAGWSAPRPARVALARWQQPDRPWLLEPLRSAVRDGIARDQALLPWRADEARRQAPYRRHMQVWHESEAFLAYPGVETIHPYQRPELFDWVARRFGVRGPARRADVLQALFGDCAPRAVIERVTRVHFNSIYWGEECRSFAERWEPTWWPSHLVDPEVLRAAWLERGAMSGTWTLMQLAWWSTRCERGDAPRSLGEIARARPRASEPPGGHGQ